MAKMVNPEVEAVRFENEDVIARSYYRFNAATQGWFYSDGNSEKSVANPTVNFGYDDNYNHTAQQAADDDGDRGWYYYYNANTGSYNREGQ